jgi:RHS repeat-associated protein
LGFELGTELTSVFLGHVLVRLLGLDLTIPSVQFSGATSSGLEVIVDEETETYYPIVDDAQGNVVGYVDLGVLNNNADDKMVWIEAQVSGYGPLPGHQMHPLEETKDILKSLAWQSRRVDPTGLFHMGARYYDPVAGAFISTDPLGHGQCHDLYSYAGGDPINYMDPSGRKQEAQLNSGTIVNPTSGLVGSFLSPNGDPVDQFYSDGRFGEGQNSKWPKLSQEQSAILAMGSMSARLYPWDIGRDVHGTLQYHAIEYIPGSRAEVYRDTYGNNFNGGRVDLINVLSFSIAEIKPNNLGAIAAGYAQLDFYTEGNGYVPDAGFVIPDYQLTLRGMYATYNYYNIGGGLIVYEVGELRPELKEAGVSVSLPRTDAVRREEGYRLNVPAVPISTPAAEGLIPILLSY